MSNNTEKTKAILGLFGMLIIGILAIMGMSQGFDGEILRYGITAIVVLAIGERAIEYFLNRRE